MVRVKTLEIQLFVIIRLTMDMKNVFLYIRHLHNNNKIKKTYKSKKNYRNTPKTEITLRSPNNGPSTIFSKNQAKKAPIRSRQTIKARQKRSTHIRHTAESLSTHPDSQTN